MTSLKAETTRQRLPVMTGETGGAYVVVAGGYTPPPPANLIRKEDAAMKDKGSILVKDNRGHWVSLDAWRVMTRRRRAIRRMVGFLIVAMWLLIILIAGVM